MEKENIEEKGREESRMGEKERREGKERGRATLRIIRECVPYTFLGHDYLPRW